MSNWKSEVAAAVVAAPVAAQPLMSAVQAQELREAAVRFEQQVRERPWSGFLAGKAETCRDMAAKLDRYGSFVSAKQAEFAAKLVGWSFPKAPETAQVSRSVEPATMVATPPVIVQQAAPAVLCPKIARVVSLDGFARFTVDKLQVAVKNDGSVLFVKYDGEFAGTIDPVSGVYRASRRFISDRAQVEATAALVEVERDPKAAAAANGIRTGRCSCCGRALTDPTSISIGIGPICLGKFG